MAVKTYVLECDNCGHSSENDLPAFEFDNDEEATEYGWYFVQGPDRELGRDGERVYCCRDCLLQGIQD